MHAAASSLQMCSTKRLAEDSDSTPQDFVLENVSRAPSR